jgi:hypothetical protein
MGPGARDGKGRGLHFTIHASRVNRLRAGKPWRSNDPGREESKNPAIAGGVWVVSARMEPAERLSPYRQAGILASSSDGSRST